MAKRTTITRRVTGIKAWQMKRARISEIPTRYGPCEVHGDKGEIHYMIAAPLPRYLYLCDQAYMEIRGKLVKKLEEIAREEGLL
jgi:hypothetical protein